MRRWSGCLLRRLGLRTWTIDVDGVVVSTELLVARVSGIQYESSW